MNFVTAERQRLIGTFERVGADADTLCEGWDAEDLLRHMVLRELFPHHGLFSKLPLKAADKSREHIDDIDTADYETLLETFKTGRHRLSPLQFGPVDRAMNTLEYVIHHEDLRRAQDPRLGRVLTPEEQGIIFSHLKAMAQMLFLKAPVQVILHSPEFGEFTAFATKRHKETVTLEGPPLELALYSFGRNRADIELKGEPEAIRKFEGVDRSA